MQVRSLTMSDLDVPAHILDTSFATHTCCRARLVNYHEGLRFLSEVDYQIIRSRNSPGFKVERYKLRPEVLGKIVSHKTRAALFGLPAVDKLLA